MAGNSREGIRRVREPPTFNDIQLFAGKAADASADLRAHDAAGALVSVQENAQTFASNEGASNRLDS